MKIRDMFVDDINRKIQGVIQVGQSTNDIIKQEVKEYVITSDLKKLFVKFFAEYKESFDYPSSDVGVWISGFFGSGKSHFLKMLSYILENKIIDGISTVDAFREKFADDPATYLLIDQSTRGETETILFNIDAEGQQKDDSAVLRVFAKMFYNHLGYYGEDIKVSRLERHIDRLGKTYEFRQAFENKMDQPWVESRDAFAFYEDTIVECLMEVLGMSEIAARNWFDSSDEFNLSVSKFVDEVKDYVDTKDKNYRLIFMIDEAGQYIGTNNSLLLNLQSIVEKLGSECLGKVWVMATGQEAIDEIIKVRQDEFSKIQARFKIRLSLTSSSADEVIQKRILSKNDQSKNVLVDVYKSNDSIMRNLFSFTESIKDIQGFESSEEFVNLFPFIPYQFKIMQKVFAEIRKHGNAGKHLSGGERSMLSAFQEAAIAIQDKDEFAIVPFFLFYDTVHSFLDGAIRRVIERCEKAGEKSRGIEPEDTAVLKLLYMVRYVDDIKTTVDNLTILMAEDIRVDKISLKAKIQESLDRLVKENYVNKSGGVYTFLTDEEQEIEREIKNTQIETYEIQKFIGDTIASDIYLNKKLKYERNDYPFNLMVDGQHIGSSGYIMTLQFLTPAYDDSISEMTLMAKSENRVIVVLDNSPYFTLIEDAKKIRKYAQNKVRPDLPESIKNIVRQKQIEASSFEKEAKEFLIKAIENATIYSSKEKMDIRSKSAKDRIDQSLQYLASNVYSKLTLINFNAQSIEDINDVLTGKADDGKMKEFSNNKEAISEVQGYLEIQSMKKLSTSMDTLVAKYTEAPFGWRELDIAYVIASLIYEQKINVKNSGQTIKIDNDRLLEMLTNKSQRGKTVINLRRAIPLQKMREVKEFLREYFDAMSIPDDEDGLIKNAVGKLEVEKNRLNDMLSKYNNNNYPDKKYIEGSIRLIKDLLNVSNDNNNFVDRLIDLQFDLEDNKERIDLVDNFFTNQVQIFDNAIKLDNRLRDDQIYIEDIPRINAPLKRIRVITNVDTTREYDYSLIPELNNLMIEVTKGHNKLLEDKISDFVSETRLCIQAVHQSGDRSNEEMKLIMTKSDDFFESKIEEVKRQNKLTVIDSYYSQIASRRDNDRRTLEQLSKPIINSPKKATVNERVEDFTLDEKTVIRKKLNKQVVFPSSSGIRNQEDIEEYLKQVEKQLRERLERELKNIDVIISIE